MRRILSSWDRWMMAITFAEAGEWRTARSLVPNRQRRRLTWFERMNVAVAFAEEGMHDEALHWAQETREAREGGLLEELERLGISGVHVRLGVLSVAD